MVQLELITGCVRGPCPRSDFFLQHAFSSHVELVSAELIDSDPDVETVSAIVRCATSSDARKMVNTFDGILADDNVLRVRIVTVDKSPATTVKSRLAARMNLGTSSNELVGRGRSQERVPRTESQSTTTTTTTSHQRSVAVERNALNQAMRRPAAAVSATSSPSSQLSSKMYSDEILRKDPRARVITVQASDRREVRLPHANLAKRIH